MLAGQTLSLYNSVIPTSVPWIPELGINVGVLSDPYTVVIVNVVAWISFLVMVYSLDYMKGDGGLTRYWFFMNFFIGSMQLIVLSDNLLSLFIGWEGVGLCSYALIGYYYKDEKEDWVGTPGSKALGEEQAYPPSHAGIKAFFMTRIGDLAMLAGILILFIYAGTFNFHQLATSSSWAVALSKNGLLVPAALAHLRRRHRQVRAVPAPGVAPRRDGRPGPGLRPDPRSDHGERRASSSWRGSARSSTSSWPRTPR